MKKKLVILLIVVLFFLPGCSKKEDSWQLGIELYYLNAVRMKQLGYTNMTEKVFYSESLEAVVDDFKGKVAWSFTTTIYSFSKNEASYEFSNPDAGILYSLQQKLEFDRKGHLVKVEEFYEDYQQPVTMTEFIYDKDNLDEIVIYYQEDGEMVLDEHLYFNREQGQVTRIRSYSVDETYYDMFVVVNEYGNCVEVINIGGLQGSSKFYFDEQGLLSYMIGTDYGGTNYIEYNYTVD